jgi:hypothetical protein
MVSVVPSVVGMRVMYVLGDHYDLVIVRFAGGNMQSDHIDNKCIILR